MKITNADVIKSGERDLIDAITADLDWSAIEEIIIKEHNLEIEEDIEYKSGDIIAWNNQIAYKLEFEIKANLSILLDRNGDYLSVAISGDKNQIDSEDGENPSGEEESADKVSHEISDPIEEPAQEGNEAGAEAQSQSEIMDNHSGDTDGYREAFRDLDESDLTEMDKMNLQKTSAENVDIETEEIESQVGEMIDEISG